MSRTRVGERKKRIDIQRKIKGYSLFLGFFKSKWIELPSIISLAEWLNQRKFVGYCQ